LVKLTGDIKPMNDIAKIQQKDIDDNMAKIAEMIGQADTSNSNATMGYPRLAIEQQNENTSGDVLPKGSYRFKMNGKALYSKNIEVRLFVRYYGYDFYSNERPEDSVRTVLQPSLSDDFPDTAGGDRCGKLGKDEIASLPANSIEHARQKNIKCTQVVYGMVTKGTGESVDKETIDLADTPFIWSARGSAFMPVANFIREIPSNKIMFSQKAKMSTKRNVNGSVIYYTPIFEKPQTVKVSETDITILNEFMEDIKGWNERVLKDHNERKENVLLKEDLDVAKELESAA